MKSLFRLFLLFTFLLLICTFIYTTKVKANENKKVAYLTFDDGPSRNTNEILKILNDNNIKATFFIIGNNIQNNETTVKRIANEEHYIGLHTMSHDYNLLYSGRNSLNRFINEILEERELIYNITGVNSNLIRFPYSNRDLINREYLEAIIDLKLKVWDWNIDTEDWKAKMPNDIIEKIYFDLQFIKDKRTLVILFHESDITVSALPLVLDLLRSQGYDFEVYNPVSHFPFNFNGYETI